jgi:acetamidase/formamidase
MLGRRGLLRAAAVVGAAGVGSTALAGTATAATATPASATPASATPASAPPASATPASGSAAADGFRYTGVLQPGQGAHPGHYVRATAASVHWGELPNRTTAPVLTVASGAVVTIDTVSHEGILEDQGKNPVEYFGDHGVARSSVLDDAVAIARSTPHSGPGPHVVTGPVAVVGAARGDVLKVEVLRLAPRVPYGVISNRHGKGALPGEYPERFEGVPRYRKYFNEGGEISVFTPVGKRRGAYRGLLPGPGGATFGLTPFLGLMGLALDTSAQVDSVPPTIGGGNIDIRDLGVGATFYLPVQVPGAKFFTGDPHFAQGDGEVALTALEASLRATVRLSVVKPGGRAPGVAFRYPFAENAQYWLPIGLSDPNGPVGGQQKSLDPAMKTAVRNALEFLTDELGMDGPVAYAYLSAATDFTVSQVVDITTGVHARIRKADFSG